MTTISSPKSRLARLASFCFIIGLVLFSGQITGQSPGEIGKYINGVFPPSTPGAGGSWELEEVLPGQSFYGPNKIISLPGSEDILVLGIAGEIWRINLEDEAAEKVLDISDRAFAKGDGATVGMVLHPAFGDASQPDKQVVFIYYRWKPMPDVWDERGYNRLSKFSWNEAAGTFDAGSEEILIQQYDRYTWHNGGSLFFGPDEMLYVSVGDEGFEGFISVSTQRLDGGLFSGILRIDVDNDPSRSHPIIRQPLQNDSPPTDWPGSFTQGYSIPDDNPWLSSEGEHLEEYFATGIRSPYAMAYDENSGLIWLADVGEGTMEEITLVEMGDNLQWPYREGTAEREEYERPNDLIGNERSPYLAYGREFGSCIIGGEVYEGLAHPELNGKYLFGDFTANRLMAIDAAYTGQDQPEIEVLMSDLGGQSVDIPSGPGITGIFVQPDGEVLITIIGSRMTATPGKIFRLKRSAAFEDPPARLSELGVFQNLDDLQPINGILPYQTNSPLWSDRALKQRWIALPNDGTFDSPEEQISFQGNSNWTFPAGTVFIKHFEMPTSLTEDSPTIRLETRFFVIGEEKRYGLTYRWNEAGTEAFLQGGSSFREFNILDENGDFAYVQRWDYPSRSQCMTCHNANADHVLGVKTHQLNGELMYPDLGQAVNQLARFNALNIFNKNIGDPAQYQKAYRIDDETADLTSRIRSYLDANCASCHQPGGVQTVSMNLRYNVPINLQNIINNPTGSNASPPDGRIVVPGNHAASELWIRDDSEAANRMPPLARNLVDEYYVDKLAEWIDGLPQDFGVNDQNTFYPNPTSDWLNIRINDDWNGPFNVKLFSINGKIIHESSVSDYIYQLDVRWLNSGVYLLQLESPAGTETEKILVR